jgi:hypothetical protein
MIEDIDNFSLPQSVRAVVGPWFPIAIVKVIGKAIKRCPN